MLQKLTCHRNTNLYELILPNTTLYRA